MIRKRLTFANVTSFLALFLALAAGSYAALKLPANSVSSKQIKAKAVTNAKLGDNAVSGPKIQADAVDGTKVKDGTLAGADINASTLGKVPSAAAADSAAISKVQIVSAPGFNTAAPSGGFSVASATATCPGGMVVTGGGVHLSDQGAQGTNDSYPPGNSAWTADVFNAGPGAPAFTVYAICAPAASTG
jgi:hypothetical protein